MPKTLIFISRYEGELDPWMSSLWRALYQVSPNLFPKGPDFVIPESKLIDQPKFQVIYHETDMVDSQLLTDTGNSTVWSTIVFLGLVGLYIVIQKFNLSGQIFIFTYCFSEPIQTNMSKCICL